MEKIYIPERWLQGCCSTLERKGLKPLEAFREAVRIWREQEQLEQKFLSEKNNFPFPS